MCTYMYVCMYIYIDMYVQYKRQSKFIETKKCCKRIEGNEEEKRKPENNKKKEETWKAGRINQAISSIPVVERKEREITRICLPF